MKNMNRPAPLCGVSCKLTRRPCKTVQSTHPRGVRHLFEHGHQLRQIISTHAPREGCDAGAEGGKQVGVDISIHAPREGCDGMMIATTMQSARFQSTHPARGATCKLGGGRKMTPNISIHAPREGCDRLLWMLLLPTQISIHAPREGCDGQRVCIWGYPKDFNPRTPRGVRPSASRPAIIPFSISIHAPREGCDGLGAISPLYFTNFNPRTPRGVRRSQCRQRRRSNSPFQSTHPARGATPQRPPGHCHTPISIHAPREGCDLPSQLQNSILTISIHAPREGCDSSFI